MDWFGPAHVHSSPPGGRTPVFLGKPILSGTATEEPTLPQMGKELQTLALGHESVQVHRAQCRLIVTHPVRSPGGDCPWTPAPALSQFKLSIMSGGCCKVFESFPFSLSWPHSFCYFSQRIPPRAPDPQKNECHSAMSTPTLQALWMSCHLILLTSR